MSRAERAWRKLVKVPETATERKTLTLEIRGENVDEASFRPIVVAEPRAFSGLKKS